VSSQRLDQMRANPLADWKVELVRFIDAVTGGRPNV
jgi:predicted metal-dependent peptidase